MLVEHDVEADIVASVIFVVVAMKQVGGDERIAFAVGQNDAQRPGMIVPGRVIRLLAELIDSHGAYPRLASFRSATKWRARNQFAFHELQDFLDKNLRLLLMRKMAGAFDRFEPRGGFAGARRGDDLGRR